MLDELKAIFANVNNWLKFAEAKNAVIFTMNAALVNTLVGYLQSQHPIVAEFPIIVLCVGGALATASALIALMSFIPKLLILHPAGERISAQDNLLFFGHLKYYTTDGFLTAFCFTTKHSAESATQLEKFYCEQIVTNARITDAKFRYFRLSAWLMFSAIFLPLANLVIYWLCGLLLTMT